jgi:hypothetical protein
VREGATLLSRHRDEKPKWRSQTRYALPRAHLAWLQAAYGRLVRGVYSTPAVRCSPSSRTACTWISGDAPHIDPRRARDHEPRLLVLLARSRCCAFPRATQIPASPSLRAERRRRRAESAFSITIGSRAVARLFLICASSVSSSALTLMPYPRSPRIVCVDFSRSQCYLPVKSSLHTACIDIINAHCCVPDGPPRKSTIRTS